MKYSFIALNLMFCIFLSACDSKSKTSNQNPPQKPLTTVEVLKAEPQQYVIKNELNGRTVATEVSEVRPQVSGIIQKRLFNEGQNVKTGDILYQIDSSTYNATYKQALANLNVQKSQLNSIKSKADRYSSLVRTGDVSKQDYEDTMSSYKELLANIEASKAAVETAKINLERTSIKAPISGEIGISSVTPGALVTAEQTDSLATIRNLDNIYVNLTQSSSELLKLKKYSHSNNNYINNVSLLLEDGTTYDELGKLLLSEINVDEDTGMVTLRAIFPNKQHILLPGMFVRAEVSQGIINEAFLIPEQAVFHDESGESYVLITNNDKVIKKIVQTSGMDNHKYIISKGIDRGDSVIIVNSNKVTVGEKVKVNLLSTNNKESL